MNSKELKLLKKWLSDSSFINWANNKNVKDICKWDNFFRNHSHFLETGEIGKQMVKGIPFVPIKINQQRKKEALLSFQQKLEQKNNSSTSFRRIVKYSISTAAAILLFLGLYTKTDYYNQIIFTTQYGEIGSYILPDNSKVSLNANSSIKYDKRHPREVWIDGEGFFEIKKKPNTMSNFKVHSKDATIIVLGTSFNVNNRDQKTKVYLKEGKIKLTLKGESTNKTIEMNPGDAISYSKQKKELKIQDNQELIKKTASWLDGSLVFKNEHIITIFNEIEKIYGVSFIIKSKRLTDKKVTIGIPVENLNVAIEALQTVLNATIERENNNFTVKEKQELRRSN